MNQTSRDEAIERNEEKLREINRALDHYELGLTLIEWIFHEITNGKARLKRELEELIPPDTDATDSEPQGPPQ